MDWQVVCLILTVLFGTSSFCCLAAGFLSLNTVVGERSRKDGRILMEKQMSGLTQAKWEARREVMELLPETWAKQRVTRFLIYCGLAFYVIARILGEGVGLLLITRPPLHNQVVQPTAGVSARAPKDNRHAFPLTQAAIVQH